MIIYGVLTNASIPQLYVAAVVPGIILAVLFSATIFLRSRFSSDWTREVVVRASWEERLRSLKYLLPPLFICLVIIGSIYSGLATPTESAGLGVVAVMVLALARRNLNWPMLAVAFESTMRTTGMIMLIIIFAYVLNFVLSGVGLTGEVNSFMTNLGLSPLATILAVVAFYLVLGCFMETLSMMIATIPIVAPVVFAAGYDPIWGEPLCRPGDPAEWRYFRRHYRRHALHSGDARLNRTADRLPADRDVLARSVTTEQDASRSTPTP
jgi:tripartite ATP-independent transporter DctM subunit